MPEVVVVGGQPRVWRLDDALAAGTLKMLAGAGLPLHYGAAGRVIVNSPFIGRTLQVTPAAGLEPDLWASELQHWLQVSGGQLRLGEDDDEPAGVGALGRAATKESRPPLPGLQLGPLHPAGEKEGSPPQLRLGVPIILWLLEAQTRRLVAALVRAFRQQDWQVATSVLPPARGPRARALKLQVSESGLALTQALFLALCWTLEDPLPMARRPLPAGGEDVERVRVHQRLVQPAAVPDGQTASRQVQAGSDGENGENGGAGGQGRGSRRVRSRQSSRRHEGGSTRRFTRSGTRDERPAYSPFKPPGAKRAARGPAWRAGSGADGTKQGARQAAEGGKDASDAPPRRPFS